MERMTCIVVDDDIMARKSLEHLCQKVDFLEVLQYCENGKQALIAMEELQPDLIFLDMDMPDISGVEFLESCSVLPQVIFFTGIKEHAFTAFEYQVTDFLQKPTNLPRFMQAVNKAYHIHQQNNQPKQAIDPAFYIREQGRLCRIKTEDILYIENISDYIRIVTTEGNHVIHGSLKGIMEKINDSRLVKVHRSYIVNLTMIKDIEDSSLVVGKKVIPISRANKPMLMSHLNLL
jgi:DNA-binding LytR/AlgR family response regulator